MVACAKGMLWNGQHPRVGDLMTPDHYWYGKSSERHHSHMRSMDGGSFSGTIGSNQPNAGFERRQGRGDAKYANKVYQKTPKMGYNRLGHSSKMKKWRAPQEKLGHEHEPRGPRKPKRKPYALKSRARKARISRNSRNSHNHEQNPRRDEKSFLKTRQNSVSARISNRNFKSKARQTVHRIAARKQRQALNRRPLSRGSTSSDHGIKQKSHRKYGQHRSKCDSSLCEIGFAYVNSDSRMSRGGKLVQAPGAPEDSLGSEAFFTPPVHFGCLGLNNFFGRKRRRRRSPNPLFVGLIGPDCDYPKDDDKGRVISQVHEN